MSDENKEQMEQEVEDITNQAPAESAAKEQPAETTPVLTEEQQIAAQALEEAEPGTEPGKEEDQTGVPVAIVAELRAERRELRTANQRLTDAIEKMVAERQAAAQPAPSVSPLKLWIDKQREEGGDPDIDAPPASVMYAHEQWKQDQAQAQAQTQQAQNRQDLGTQSVVRAQKTYSDFDEIVEIGSQYLTKGNKVDITESDDPAALLYKLCIKATLESGTTDAQAMRQRLKSKQPASKTKTTVPAKTKQKEQSQEEEVGTPAPERPMNRQLAHICGALGV